MLHICVCPPQVGSMYTPMEEPSVAEVLPVSVTSVHAPDKVRWNWWLSARLQCSTKKYVVVEWRYCSLAPSHQENAWKDGLKGGMLIYHNHLQKWFNFGQYWPNFGPLVAKKLSEIKVSWHSKENARKEWFEMWHADVSWPPPEIIRFWSVLAQFWAFGPLAAKKLSVIGVSEHSEGTHGRNGLKFAI